MAEAKVKASAYAKRNSSSTAAPLELDSDSDFNAGYVEPEKKEKKKTTKMKTKTKRKSAKHQSESSDSAMESDESEKPRKKKRKVAVPKRKIQGRQKSDNPLLEFFIDMDLHSEPSDDDDPMDGPSYEAEEEEDAAPSKFKGLMRRSPPSPSHSGDTTEEESDDEPMPTKSPKLPKPTAANSDSDTVSESEDSEPVSRPVSKATPVPPKPTPPDESDTESESDDDSVPFTPEQAPRPGFPLGLDQMHLGPLVLDAAQGIQVPGAINTYLREYQRDGVRFFWERYREGRGGLLGDDMGLVRKTIQVISFLSAIMKKNGVRADRGRRKKHVSSLQDGKEWRKHKRLPPANATWPTCLIIAPATVVHNWEREFELWGYFEVGSYVGAQKEREVVLKDFIKGRFDVVLTSLDTARRDISLLEELPWSCVIVDEVHTVKNPRSKTSIAYNRFDCIRRFGLTGTAIQNSYDELWTILDWTSPGKVGERSQWRGFISKPLKDGQSTTASEEQQLKAHSVSKILHDKLLPRFFLRRTKSIIRHQLPNKSDEVVFCPLTNVQIAVYKRILAVDEVQAMLHRDDPCHCGSEKPQKKCCVGFNSATIFKFMHVLIKLSNHLGLLLPSPSDSHEQLTRNRELTAMAFPKGNAPKYGTAILEAQYCGKWTVLLTLLDDWRKDRTNKALIFTKSVKLLEMLSFHLKIQGYGFLQLDGSTKQLDRMPMIDQFHRDPGIFVFLISTMAGGTGLNLTGANKVVIFDPNWNPAYDLQAMDRAFRFGQTRDVSVFRLLGAGSVEELIYARQVLKQQQMKIGYEASIQTRYFEGVQGDKSNQGELFGINNIFKLHEGGLTTKMAIEKAHLAELDWALGSMDSSKGKKKNGPDNEIAAKFDSLAVGKDFGDLKGLGALLFDDGPPRAEPATGLPKITGIYTHQNPDLLVSSKIEQERTKEMKIRKKARKSAGIQDDEQHAKQWPPVRVHHKHCAQSAEDNLREHIDALVGTGIISHPNKLPQFALQFRTYTPEQQAFVQKTLNDYVPPEDDSSDDDEPIMVVDEPEYTAD